MFKKIIFLSLFSLLIISCGTRREAVEIEEAAATKVIAAHYGNAPEFQTLSSRMKLNYQDEERTQAVTLSFRMQKDSVIWVSAQLLGIPLAKALITREGVSYYEKISKTYFEGDYRLLSQYVGTPLDYDKLQNLLLGQAIYDLRTDRYQLGESPAGYRLQPVNELQAVTRLFLLDPATYKALAQQLSQKKENRHVTVTYPKYQRVNGRLLPEQIKIIASEGGQGTQIDIEFRSVSLNSPVSFPFDIPSGYDEISLE